MHTHAFTDSRTNKRRVPSSLSKLIVMLEDMRVRSDHFHAPPTASSRNGTGMAGRSVGGGNERLGEQKHGASVLTGSNLAPFSEKLLLVP